MAETVYDKLTADSRDLMKVAADLCCASESVQLTGPDVLLAAAHLCPSQLRLVLADNDCRSDCGLWRVANTPLPTRERRISPDSRLRGLLSRSSENTVGPGSLMEMIVADLIQSVDAEVVDRRVEVVTAYGSLRAFGENTAACQRLRLDLIRCERPTESQLRTLQVRERHVARRSRGMVPGQIEAWYAPASPNTLTGRVLDVLLARELYQPVGTLDPGCAVRDLGRQVLIPCYPRGMHDVLGALKTLKTAGIVECANGGDEFRLSTLVHASAEKVEEICRAFDKDPMSQCDVSYGRLSLASA